MPNFSTAKNSTQYLYFKLHFKWYCEVVREFYIKYKILVIFLALLAAPSVSTLIQLICFPVKQILNTNTNLIALFCVLAFSYALGLAHKKVFNQNTWNTYLSSLPILRLTKIISTVLILTIINSVFIVIVILNAQHHLIKSVMLLAMIVAVECLGIYHQYCLNLKLFTKHPIYLINFKILKQSSALNLIRLMLMVILSLVGLLLTKNKDIPAYLQHQLSLSILLFNIFIINTSVKNLFNSWAVYKNYLSTLPLISIKIATSILLTIFIFWLPFLIFNSLTFINFTPATLLIALTYFAYTFITQVIFNRFGLMFALLGMPLFIYLIN